MITEDEARTKLCCGPILLAETWINEEAIKAGRQVGTGRCIASACMAWRKDNEGNYDQHGNLSGYCGLAGRS
jgi:hypothetical protein